MIEDLLEEINSRGWFLNNLFQLPDGTYQANLRTATKITDFAVADSPSLALALAIDKIESAHKTKPESIAVFTGDLDLANLRSLVKRPTFIRRF